MFGSYLIFNRKNSCFLLGGNDLEMLEIRRVLEENSLRHVDYQLTWGAKLSAYKTLFNDREHFIGIELEEDIPPPKYYTAIDHHNEHSHKLSSLEQIARLLTLTLTRKQMLIAKNDSGYINAMKMIGASDEEINEIRALDRKAQGVTQKDEKLALISIENANNSNIIKALTPKFSTISDRVYDKYKKYIIYDDSAVVFYGYKITELKKYIVNDIYYGGGDFGFFGIKKNALHVEEIKHLIEEINNNERE